MKAGSGPDIFYHALYGESPSERGTFFRLQLHVSKTEGISRWSWSIEKRREKGSPFLS